jgi:hypothetical protein
MRKKYSERLESFKLRRDSFYALLFLWVIFYPQDYMLYIPVGLLAWAFFEWRRKKSFFGSRS